MRIMITFNFHHLKEEKKTLKNVLQHSLSLSRSHCPSPSPPSCHCLQFPLFCDCTKIVAQFIFFFSFSLLQKWLSPLSFNSITIGLLSKYKLHAHIRRCRSWMYLHRNQLPICTRQINWLDIVQIVCFQFEEEGKVGKKRIEIAIQIFLNTFGVQLRWNLKGVPLSSMREVYSLLWDLLLGCLRNPSGFLFEDFLVFYKSKPSSLLKRKKFWQDPSDLLWEECLLILYENSLWTYIRKPCVLLIKKP